MEDVLDGAKVGADDFRKAWHSGLQYVLLEVYDDAYKHLGWAAATIMRLYKQDKYGAFATLDYLGSSSEYYQWYIDHPDQQGGLRPNTYHHYCRGRQVGQCKAFMGGNPVVHVQRWKALSFGEVNRFLKRWKQPFLVNPGPGDVASGDAGGSPVADGKDTRRARSLRRPSPSEVYQEVFSEDEEEEARNEELQPRKSRKRKSHKTESEPSSSNRGKPFPVKASALDRMLEDERLSVLKKQLQSSLGDGGRSKERGSASSILAARTQQAEERG